MSEPNDVHRDREVVWRNPKDLKLHPAHERFPELDPVFYQAMREDIRVHDIRVPLEILLDDTVIAGKTRRGMAIELGKKLVPCVIRHDLTGASSSKVIRALEADNLNRRQLDKLALARLHETLRHGPADESTEDHLERWERRKQVAKLLGDERTKRRWFNASKLQGYLEDCFKRGTITLVQAEKISLFNPQQQEEVAQRIAAKETPAAIIASYRQRDSSTAAKTVQTLLKNFLQKLNLAVKRTTATGCQTNQDLSSQFDVAKKNLETLVEAIVTGIKSNP